MNKSLKKTLSILIAIAATGACSTEAKSHRAPKETISSRCACICKENCKCFSCPTADIVTSAQVVAMKALNKLPVDPNKDFPPNVANFTDSQREEYRREFAKNIECNFGCPIGWKLALGNASPTTPVLGYTEPSIGQLFTKMIICSTEALITNEFAVGAAHEVDVIIRVSNEAINGATEPEQIIENIDALFPFYELPAFYVPTIQEIAGPNAPFFGNALLTPLNAAARLGMIGNAIPVPGKRTTQEWIETLTRLTGTETIQTTTGTTVRQFGTANFMNYALTLITLLNKNGITVKKGDLLSLGNLTGTAPFQPTELKLSALYTNLDPDGPVTMTLLVGNVNGLCIGGSPLCTDKSQKCS